MNIKRFVMLVLTAAILISFFLPWVNVASDAVGGITKLLTVRKQNSLTSISGYQVPIMANNEKSRFMIAVITIFLPDITNADKKSYLTGGVPLLAVVMYLASCVWFKKSKWIKLVNAVIGIAVFAVVLFKINTTDLEKGVIRVEIAYGLWTTLLGYLLIGVLELSNFIKLSKR